MYTRKGDKGETSLYGAKRVAKDSPRVEAYGAIDELNSVLGTIVASSRDPKIKSSLLEVQRLLFVAGADAASEFEEARRVPRISDNDTDRIETLTDHFGKDLPRLTNFILPGGSVVGAQLQFARSICRRTERRIVSASKTEQLNPELIRFFNRLSSLLFNMSRTANVRAGKKETIWKS